MPLTEKYVSQAKAILEDLALRKAKPIPYVELTNRLGIATRSAGGVLRPISEESYKASRVLLSVLVVNSKTGLPSERFFVQAKELGAMRDDELPQLFFRAELERVYNLLQDNLSCSFHVHFYEL